MKIIPAIDIIDGKCVRLSKGDYNSKKIYNENPLEVALMFQDSGVEYLHLVDLDGAKSSRIINYRILEEIAVKSKLKIDFGGGIKSDEDLKIAFESGASQATVGSIAVKDEELFLRWLNAFGSEKIILGADFLNEKIAINGWLKDSGINIYDFIEDYTQKGVENIICTDISKDGMLEGSSVETYRNIISKHNDINLIASGGISSIGELGKLKEEKLYGAIIGKAIYENKITLKEIEKFILENN